jgi:hemerythrin superfamily protein
MNATQLLKQDHGSVKRLFRDLERARDDTRKARLFAQLRSEVEAHSMLEEEIFYPAVFEQAAGNLGELVDHAEEEHSRMKSLLAEISALQPDDPRFDARTGELRSCIEDHVDEEEGQMFPQTRATLGDRQLEALGREMEERKERLEQPVARRLMGSVKAPMLGETKGKRRTRGAGATGRRAPARNAAGKAGTARKGRTAAKARVTKRTQRRTKQTSRVKGRRRASGQRTRGRSGQRARNRPRRSSGR